MGDLDFWREGLATEGVKLRDDGKAELVVAPARLVDDALGARPHALICHGDATGELASAGYVARAYLPIPSAAAPRAWLPLDEPAVVGYVLRGWTVASTRLKGMRNELLRWLTARGRPPLPGSWVTVAARDDVVPGIVGAAARDAAVPGIVGAAARAGAAGAAWFLTVGAGDSLDYRGVFHLFPPAAARPRWIVKFARRHGLEEPFERDRIGLELAARSGPAVVAHAPQLVGSFEHEGRPASVETAATGAALSAVLRRRGAQRAKLEVIERVASWIVQVGAASATPGAAAEEIGRLGRVVEPQWRDFGLEEDLAAMIGDVPGVLQHNDLWSENVIVDGREFMVVDWEDARAHGLPLWDLVYFLADALARLDGAYGGRARREHFVSLFKGTARSSRILFEWMRRGAAECAVAPDAVAPIVTACWLSQVLAHVTRGEDAVRFAEHGLAQLPPGEQWATLWLSDPSLGPRWSSWRA